MGSFFFHSAMRYCRCLTFGLVHAMAADDLRGLPISILMIAIGSLSHVVLGLCLLRRRPVEASGADGRLQQRQLNVEFARPPLPLDSRL